MGGKTLAPWLPPLPPATRLETLKQSETFRDWTSFTKSGSGTISLERRRVASSLLDLKAPGLIPGGGPDREEPTGKGYKNNDKRQS